MKQKNLKGNEKKFFVKKSLSDYGGSNNSFLNALAPAKAHARASSLIQLTTVVQVAACCSKTLRLRSLQIS
jgi:hypothetical protein